MINTDIFNVCFDEDDIFGMEFTELQQILIRAGKDCTHEWNGTELTVTSASGTSSADLKGDDGTGIKSFEMEFYASDSETDLTGGSWTASIPDAATGKYLWTRNVVSYEDGRISYGIPVRCPIWESVNGIPAALESHVKNTSNPHKVTLSQLGAIGYRRTLTTADDLNEITDDGVYVYSTASIPANAPFANAAVILVFGARSDSTQKIQLAFRYGITGCCKFRPLYGNQWLTWASVSAMMEDTNSPDCYYQYTNGIVEWANPPLLDGVEYRTTERFNGEPVYVKMIDFGTLPSSTSKTLSSGSTIANLVKVDTTTLSSNGTKSSLPLFNTSGTLYARYHITNAGTVVVTTFADLSSYTANFILRYTK